VEELNNRLSKQLTMFFSSITEVKQLLDRLQYAADTSDEKLQTLLLELQQRVDGQSSISRGC